MPQKLSRFKSDAKDVPNYFQLICMSKLYINVWNISQLLHLSLFGINTLFKRVDRDT